MVSIISLCYRFTTRKRNLLTPNLPRASVWSLENLASPFPRRENKSFFFLFLLLSFQCLNIGSIMKRKTWILFKREGSEFMENSQSPGNL